VIGAQSCAAFPLMLPAMALNLTETRIRHVDAGLPLDPATRAALNADPRSAARAILAAVARKSSETRWEGQRLRTLLRYETQLWKAGMTQIAGVDEAGMSPLAGPVAAAAVICAPGARIPGVDDSKKLSPADRERLAGEIKETAICWSIGFAEVEEIDSINIYWAGILSMRRAIEALAQKPDHVLIDGRCVNNLPHPQQAIIRGDSKSHTIAAASKLAKTARDALMHRLDASFPGYGLSRHKGYAVREHLVALNELGISPIHRRSFAPVRLVLGLPPLAPWPKPPTSKRN
jgi:ribonuclease HII